MPYLVFSPDAAAQSCQFLTAICLNPNAVPKFEVLQDENYIGARVRTPDTVEEVYLDRRAIQSPGTISINTGEWVTDAYLLHIKRSTTGDKSVQRFFMGDGSYLRHKGGSIIESLSKMTACWSPGEVPEIVSDSASDSIQIAAKHPASSVKWNGRSVPGQYDPATKLVAVHKGR